jgi:hypothetical protein
MAWYRQLLPCVTVPALSGKYHLTTGHRITHFRRRNAIQSVFAGQETHLSSENMEAEPDLSRCRLRVEALRGNQRLDRIFWTAVAVFWHDFTYDTFP